MNTVLYVGGCVVLPVLWGALIHWVFQRLRRYQDQSPDHWPDYQI